MSTNVNLFLQMSMNIYKNTFIKTQKMSKMSSNIDKYQQMSKNVSKIRMSIFNVRRNQQLLLI